MRKRKGKTKKGGTNAVGIRIRGGGTLIVVLVIIGLFIGYTQVTSESTTPSVIRGKQLYETYCASCHGVNGVGERPDDIYAMDEYGFVAPPMDDTGHAWHHTDEDLVEMILEGSPRNPRMIGWKSVLSREDAEDLVEYIKSLWSPYIRENCQGPKHMKPECGGHASG